MMKRPICGAFQEALILNGFMRSPVCAGCRHPIWVHAHEAPHPIPQRPGTPIIKDAVFVLLHNDIPCGTTFAVRCRHQNMLLTVAHNVCDENGGQLTGQFSITLRVERDRRGGFLFSNPVSSRCPSRVDVHTFEYADDYAILKYSFSNDNSIPLCPADAVPPDMSTHPVFHLHHCPVGPFVDGHINSTGCALLRRLDLISIAPLHREICFSNVLFSGSSRGVVVDEEGRAVAMHLRSRNSAISPSEVPQEAISGLRADAKNDEISDRDIRVYWEFNDYS